MTETIKTRLEGLRGAEYYEAWRHIWQTECGPVRELCAKKKADGQFTIADLLSIRDAYELPFKPFVQQLEKDGYIRNGTYDRLPPLKELQKMQTEAVHAAAVKAGEAS